MTLWKLVQSNITRRRGRFILTLLGITIGIASLVTLLAIGRSLDNEIRRQSSDLGANLVVTPRGWCAYEQISVLTGEQLPEAIPSDTVAKISAISGLTVSPYLTERTAINNNPVSVLGIVPEGMRALKGWEVQQGGYLASADERAVVVGSAIAQQFKLGNSDELTIRGEQFPIKGVLKETGGKDDTTVFVPLSVVQRLYSVGGNVSFLAVKVDDISRIDQYVQKIQDTANVAVTSDKQLLKSVLSIVGTVSLTLQLIATVGLLAAAFSIVNTMTTAVYERRREIGILQAIGAKRRTIFTLFLVESGIYGLIGGVVGLAAGQAFAWIASPYISPNEFTAFFNGSGLPVGFDPGVAAAALSLALLASVASGLYPAWRASRLTPVEAISV